MKFLRDVVGFQGISFAAQDGDPSLALGMTKGRQCTLSRIVTNSSATVG